MIEAMKQALEALEWGQPLIEDYGSKEQLQAHLSAKDALYKEIEADMYRNPDTVNPCEGWNPSDMAHRSGGLSVEQAEKQEHKPWCDYLNIMLTSLPPQKAKCNCKQAQPEQAEKQAPTKLFGPNLEQILNAAGFYKKREWIGLTEEEVGKYSDRLNGGDIAREVEAKLKERNNG
jgi:hypothetical protein